MGVRTGVLAQGLSPPGLGNLVLKEKCAGCLKSQLSKKSTLFPLKVICT